MAPTESSVTDDLIHASERWYARLTGSERNGRIAVAVLSSVLVFLGSIILVIVSDATPYRLTLYFIEYGTTLYFEVAGVASILVGVMYYALTRRRHSRYADLRQLIDQTKAEAGPGHEVALTLAGRMVALLPKMRQERYDEALLFGVLSFFLTAFLFPMNVIVAVAVWLYFRYEATSTYNVEITRFDGWKLKLQTL